MANQAKIALATRLREEGKTLQEIGLVLGVSRETVRKWLTSDAAQAFCEEVKEKSLARPKRAVGKVRPRSIVTPSSFRETIPWWRICPPLVVVDIPSGQVLIFRWPLE